MAKEYASCQLYVDAEYIRNDLARLGLGKWFGTTELIRPLLNLRIDAKELIVRRTIIYDAIDHHASTADEHEEYLRKLGKMNDTVIRLGTVTGTRNKRQKGVDMRIGRDMMVAAKSGFVDYIALASGDADFIPAIQEVQDLGPKVIIVAFEGSLSVDLILESDRHLILPENAGRNWDLS